MSPRPARLASHLSTCALALGALLAVAGCGSSVESASTGDPPSVEPVEPSVEPAEGIEVGGGSASFQELGAGATVPLVAGGQGGYHLWLSVRCSRCGPTVTLSFGIEDAETGELLSVDGLQAVAEMQEHGAFREVVGLTGFLQGYDPTMYLERRVRLWATITDASGEAHDAEAEATISGTEYDDGGFG